MKETILTILIREKGGIVGIKMEYAMRKFCFILIGAIASLYFSSCQVNEVFVPVQSGEEIIFGSSLPGTVNTRTIYGDEIVSDASGRYYPVYWESNDSIAIYCPQSASIPRVDYTITPDTSDPVNSPSNRSSAVTKIGDVGLQWGMDEKHEFYAFYPAKAVIGVDGDGLVEASVPVVQNPVRWIEDVDTDGSKIIRGVANTDYAYMYSYCSLNKSELASGESVPLTFHHLSTILEITVNGPESGSPIKISSVNVNAVDPEGQGQNVVLTGDFVCNMTDIENGNVTCDVAGDLNEVRNRITISCWNQTANDGNGDYVELGPGDKLVLQAYCLPNDDGFETQTLQVSVSPVNSRNKVKTLQTAEILAHKVNRVSLPHMTTGGTNYWLDSLDPDIYITELSLPGSHNSMLTSGNEASTVYQTASITEQFEAGVRAFMIQTAAVYEMVGFLRWDWRIYATVDGATTPMTLEDIVSELNACLATSQSENFDNEFVFLQITYEPGPTDDNGYDNQADAWINKVCNEISSLSQSGNYSIYADEITSNTTIDDVKGKIVFKLNTNLDNDMSNCIAADASYPALFSEWQSSYVDGGVDLRWGTSNESKQSNMTWYYQEGANIVLDASNENIAGGRLTYAHKVEYAGNVFNYSVDMYKNNSEHNIWFMNDLGGSYYDGKTSTSYAVQFTEDISPWALEVLQGRNENASLGIIYMNYADNLENSGQTYGTANLIQTIVDNNFKFQLRKKGTATTTFSTPVTGSSAGWDSEN